jgi:ATP-dependent helicase HrpB
VKASRAAVVSGGAGRGQDDARARRRSPPPARHPAAAAARRRAQHRAPHRGANRAGRSGARSAGTSGSSGASRRDTRLLVVTEGILTARLQQDPLLSDFRTVVLDEFHERSIHADLAIALAKQAWLARDDLRIVVMSATMDAAPVAAYLGDCPIVDVPGATFPLDVPTGPGLARAGRRRGGERAARHRPLFPARRARDPAGAPARARARRASRS